MDNPCRGANLDVVFLLDGSGSMTEAGFALTKEFLAIVAESLSIGANMTQVSVVQFSDRFSLDIRLNQFTSSVSQLATAIRNIPFHNSGTQIGEALDFTLAQAFVPHHGDRVCSPDVAVVITDGKDRGLRGIPGPVSMAGCRHITTIGVGVGASVSDEELLQIAAGDPTRRFHVDGVEDLQSIHQKLCSVIRGKPANPCLEQPCANRGTCIPDEDFQDFACLCPPGYEGHRCSVDINECSPDPCVHGRCADEIAAYQCACDDGWQGRQCQFEKCDPCPCWALIFMSALCLLLLLLLIYCWCCRKKVKVVERLTVIKPPMCHKFCQVDIRPPTPPPALREPTPPPPEPTYVLPPVDILFCVDNSGSVGLSNFSLIRTFLHRFLEHLLLPDSDGNAQVSAEYSQFGVMVFNRSPKIIVPMSSEPPKALVKRIDNLPYEGHNTRLGEALLSAFDILKVETKRRFKIPKVCVVLSDGFSEDEIGKGAASLHALGVTMVAIGVRKINKDTFLTLTRRKELIFQVTSFNDLKLWLRRRIVEELNEALQNSKQPKLKRKLGKKARSKSISALGAEAQVPSALPPIEPPPRHPSLSTTESTVLDLSV